MIGGAACAVAVQYAMKLLVDAMASQDRLAANVWVPFGFFIGLIAMENVLWRTGGWLGCRTIVKTGVDLRIDLFEHLTGHPMRYFKEHFSGALGNRINQTGTAVANIFTALTWRIIPPCTDFLGAVVVLLTIQWRMALVLVAFVLLVALVITGFGIRGRYRHQAFAEQASRVGGEVVDMVSNVWTIKAFSARERERDRLARELGVEARAQRRSWMYVEKARILHDACLTLMAGSMLIWAILLWRQGSVTPGDVVVVSALTFRILHGSRDLALALVDTAQQFGIVADTLKIIAKPHEIKDLEGAGTLKAQAGAIDFENITFSYPNGQKVIDQLTLHIPAGQKVGIVGTSGAGKSTLINLLQRLDDVDGGRILIDGQPINEVSQDSLRAAIAVVPQEIALFNRTIRENIRYGKPGATDEEVYQAACHAYCDHFIQHLPEGYNTMVGERGACLSGGQRQRLGIARAFLKGSPILILDEATSALDTHSEKEIQLALTELVRGRTVLAVAHRLSTVANFDRVIVMDKGRIVEDGPPAALRRSGGLFESLWNIQATALEENETLPQRNVG
nr:ABC transporter ATP-binding protein [Pseudomonas duriflava]